jgi:hemolysin III
MLTGVANTQPDYTFGEEFCNVITHGSGFAFALYQFLKYRPDGVPTDEESEKKRISPSGKRLLLFSFVVLFGNSTLYHAFVPGTFKTIFRFIDHFSVVITMLGTTAPVICHGLSRWLAGLVFFVLLSVIAAFVYFGIFYWVEFESWEVSLYFPFAVICSALTIPGFKKVDARARFQFMKGLLVYACGIPFFIRDDVRYAHSVFHCAIAAGGYCHYRAIMD